MTSRVLEVLVGFFAGDGCACCRPCAVRLLCDRVSIGGASYVKRQRRDGGNWGGGGGVVRQLSKHRFETKENEKKKKMKFALTKSGGKKGLKHTRGGRGGNRWCAEE
jgi:hypothetical protein